MVGGPRRVRLKGGDRITLGELKAALDKLSEEQLKTEACVFVDEKGEEGNILYTWIDCIEDATSPRPKFRGVLSEGEKA